MKCDVDGCGKVLKNAQGLAGHKRWAHGDDSKPLGAAVAQEEPDERTLELFGDLDGRVSSLESAEREPATVSMEQLGPELREYLRENGAHPGICTDEKCSPCRSARAELSRQYAQEGRDQFAGELEAAAAWGGHVAVAEDLAQMHSDWIAQGKPKADEKPGARRFLVKR